MPILASQKYASLPKLHSTEDYANMNRSVRQPTDHQNLRRSVYCLFDAADLERDYRQSCTGERSIMNPGQLQEGRIVSCDLWQGGLMPDAGPRLVYQGRCTPISHVSGILRSVK
jgi:hypothetical protein